MRIDVSCRRSMMMAMSKHEARAVAGQRGREEGRETEKGRKGQASQVSGHDRAVWPDVSFNAPFSPPRRQAHTTASWDPKYHYQHMHHMH